MPARKRGQEARRAERRASRPVSTHYAWELSEDQVWAEHQAGERLRRIHDPIAEARIETERAERRRRMWREVLAARDAVLADFERWRS